MFNLHNPLPDPLAVKLLSNKQKKKYLDLLLAGNAQVNILYHLNVSKEQYRATVKAEPGFKEAIKNIKENRGNQIESGLMRYATGKAAIIKKTYTCKRDEMTGEPVKDKKGRIEFECTKKEITQLPPNPMLVKLYYDLQDKDPESEEVFSAS